MNEQVDKKPRAEQRPRRHNNRRRDVKPKKLYDEVIIETKAIFKVTTGGRQRRFSAVAVVGDRKGTVGIGTGKANEITDAIKKAIQSATKNVVKIPLIDDRTIAHEVIGKSGASRVMLKPAYEGTGVKAGGAARAVLEMAGVKDIMTKALGSRTKLNLARATLNGLQSTKTVEQVANVRGKTPEEIV